MTTVPSRCCRNPQRIALGRLGGLPVDAQIGADHTGRALVKLTLHGLPAAPAALERGQLREHSLSLIRQLEHRVENLPALADRLDGQREAALAEQRTAREQLARPFKYAEQLSQARDEQRRIDGEIAARHADSQPPALPPSADEDAVRAAHAAAFPTPPRVRPPAAVPVAACPHPPRHPSRGPTLGR